MAKRNKKFNPVKTANAIVKASMRNSGVIFVTGGPGAQLINLKTHARHAPNLKVAKALEHLEAKWCVLCAVLLRGNDGKNYASYYLDHWNKTRKQSQIAEEAYKVHQRLLDSCQDKHLVNLGWIAVPELWEFTDEGANAMFHKAGAWDALAKWEKKIEDQ